CEAASVPWVRAELRGQKVYARADANGALRLEGGRVEVRYRPADGRRYLARAANLTIVDATPLADDTCAPVAQSTDAGRPKRSASAARRAASPRAGAEPTGGGSRDALIVYADGACSGNPGPAGLGVVIVDRGERTELSEFLGQGTNNIAELTAILRALEL